MIPLKPNEIRLLVETRDLLKAKLAHKNTTNSLQLNHAYNGVMEVLHAGVVDVDD